MNMLDKIQSVIAYICSTYPHKGELSNARLTKLVYLADWFSALKSGKQITNIQWVFNHYGPFVEDVQKAAAKSKLFTMKNTLNNYGGSKTVFGYIGDMNQLALTIQEKSIIDEVISATEKLYFNDFIKFVYDTYPVSSRTRYSQLVLPELADELRGFAQIN